VLRWLALLPMLLLLLSSAYLVPQGGFYRSMFGLQVVCYVLALTGWMMRNGANRPSIVTIPYYFVLVNVASLKGIAEYYQGRTYATWSTVREG
jgi:hypothetical protein